MKQHLFFIAIAFALVLAACAPGFTSKSSSPTPGNNTGSGGGGGGTGTDNSATWMNMKSEVESNVDGGAYSGQPLIALDQANQTLDLILPLPPVAILPISMLAFKELPGSYMKSVTLQDGSDGLALSIPLKYVLRGATLNPFNKLPNGDPLPYLPAGEVNGFSVTLPQQTNYRLTIYIAVSAAAVFIETPSWTFPDGTPAFWYLVKNKAKTRQIGFLQITPNKGTFSSGVYVAAKLPSDIARVLNTIVKF